MYKRAGGVEWVSDGFRFFRRAVQRLTTGSQYPQDRDGNATPEPKSQLFVHGSCTYSRRILQLVISMRLRARICVGEKCSPCFPQAILSKHPLLLGFFASAVENSVEIVKRLPLRWG